MVRLELPDNWQELATGHVLGNLSDEEQLVWEQIQYHPDIAEAVKALRDTFNVFADVIPMHQPPARLLGKIQAAAQRPEPTVNPSLRLLTAPSTAAAHSSDRRNWLVGLSGAIAATLVAALGWRVYALSSALQQAKAEIQTLDRSLQQAQAQDQSLRPVVNTLQQPGTLIYSLHGSTLANSASGSLVLSTQKQVIVVVQNLPQLPDGQTYRLWADLSTQSALTYCGQFNSNREGVIQLTPSSDRCGDRPKQMLITIDATTDPTTKGGPVVMQGQV
jgi:hypothetical protein